MERSLPDRSDSAEALPSMPRLSDYYRAAESQHRTFLPEVRAAVRAARAAKTDPPSFDEDDVRETLQRLPELDPTLSRTVKLLGKEPQQVRHWVARATLNAFNAFPSQSGHESEPVLARFDRFLRLSTDDLLGRDRQRRERAQNLLRLSLPWLVEKQNLKPEDALPLVGRAKRERTKTADLRRDMLRLLFRTPFTQLMNLSLVGAWFEKALAEEKRARLNAFRELSRHQEEEAARTAELDEVRARLQGMTEERDRLAESLRDTEAQLNGQKELRAIDRKQIVGRSRRFLEDRLSRLVSDARDALDCDPPYLDIVRQRLESTSEAIERELVKDDE